MSDDDLIIQSRGLTKRYGDVAAVTDLGLAVHANRITGFLGRNGAGKSSTIRMLLGMISPSAGEATVLGHPIVIPAESQRMRRHVAYVGEDKGLYPYMTVAQLVRFTRAFYPDWQADVEQRLLREYALPLGRRVKALSKGMRTKLALLLALARRPRLLILDEPTEGLDPVSIEELLQTLVRCGADGTSIFFSSHQLSDVERIADDVVVIDRGRQVLVASLERIRADYRTITLGYAEEPSAANLQWPGVQRVRVHGRQATLLTSAGADAIVRRAQSTGAVTVDVSPITLRELFLATVDAGA